MDLPIKICKWMRGKYTPLLLKPDLHLELTSYSFQMILNALDYEENGF